MEEVLVVIGEKENLNLKHVHFVLDIEKDRRPMIRLLSGYNQSL